MTTYHDIKQTGVEDQTTLLQIATVPEIDGDPNEREEHYKYVNLQASKNCRATP